MRTIIMTFLFLCSAFAQGMYLPNQNGIGGGIYYGHYGYTSDKMLGFSATYSYRGFVEISYTRSSVLTQQDIKNYHNEYILRGYLFNGNRFFLSGAIGYQDFFVETELWTDFKLDAFDDGFLFEGGAHLATTDQETKKIVVSFFYRLFESTERIHTVSIDTPSKSFIESKLSSAFTFDAALIYYLSQIGIAIGPRLIFEDDFSFPFIGFNLSLMMKH